MRRSFAVSAILGLCLIQPGFVEGQVTRLEFGVDMGLERATISDFDYTTTAIAIPTQWVRFGIHVRDLISFEPRLGLTRISDDDGSQLQARISVALLVHFRPRAGGPSFFVEGIGGIDYVSLDYDGNSESATQFRVGGGAGFLLPIRDTFAFRGAGEYHRSFETDDAPAANRIVLTVGFSFFLEQ